MLSHRGNAVETAFDNDQDSPESLKMWNVACGMIYGMMRMEEERTKRRSLLELRLSGIEVSFVDIHPVELQ